MPAMPRHAEKKQEALKSNWTNTAVIAALMFSMVVPYGFPLDSGLRLREFNGGQRAEEKFGYLFNEVMQVSFYHAVCFSFWEYLIAMLLAAFHLM